MRLLIVVVLGFSCWAAGAWLVFGLRPRRWRDRTKRSRIGQRRLRVVPPHDAGREPPPGSRGWQ